LDPQFGALQDFQGGSRGPDRGPGWEPHMQHMGPPGPLHPRDMYMQRGMGRSPSPGPPGWDSWDRDRGDRGDRNRPRSRHELPPDVRQYDMWQPQQHGPRPREHDRERDWRREREMDRERERELARERERRPDRRPEQQQRHMRHPGERGTSSTPSETPGSGRREDAAPAAAAAEPARRNKWDKAATPSEGPAAEGLHEDWAAFVSGDADAGGRRQQQQPDRNAELDQLLLQQQQQQQRRQGSRGRSRTPEEAKGSQVRFRVPAAHLLCDVCFICQ
jgi:hypothetical protein